MAMIARLYEALEVSSILVPKCQVKEIIMRLGP
jgi:hypothetical protein